MTSTGCAADATSTRRSAATGGSAAPLPSSTTSSAPSPVATATPSTTFETATAPASPPPQRRHPTVVTPATTAVSRWSEAACRPLRESSSSVSTVGRATTTSGSGGPPLPIATTTVAPRRGEAPGDVARDGRLADPLAGADHGERRDVDDGRRRRVEAEVGALVGDAEREDAAREREPLRRAEHRLVGEVEDDVGLMALDRDLDGGLERHAVAVDVAAELLGAADEHGRDDEIVDLLERRADDGRIVLAVDDRDHAPHPRVVTSASMRPVYFSYANVSVENWMMRSSPWKGWRREIETWWPLISTTL